MTNFTNLLTTEREIMIIAYSKSICTCEIIVIMHIKKEKSGIYEGKKLQKDIH